MMYKIKERGCISRCNQSVNELQLLLSWTVIILVFFHLCIYACYMNRCMNDPWEVSFGAFSIISNGLSEEVVLRGQATETKASPWAKLSP